MLWLRMKQRWVGCVVSLSLAALVVACSSEARQELEPEVRGEAKDAGVDAGCPEYPDSGTIQLTRRCPLTIPYRIQ
jgi:hypothetical protein